MTVHTSRVVQYHQYLPAGIRYRFILLLNSLQLLHSWRARFKNWTLNQRAGRSQKRSEDPKQLINLLLPTIDVCLSQLIRYHLGNRSTLATRVPNDSPLNNCTVRRGEPAVDLMLQCKISTQHTWRIFFVDASVQRLGCQFQAL